MPRNLRPILAALLLLAAVALHAAPAEAQGRRVAFVIGIDSYQSVDRLTRAKNDATAIADRLKASGFDVVLRTDADRRAINDGMSEFEEKLRGAEVGFFFFAGHGVEIRGTNVLLPADLPATLSETVVLREGLLLSDVAQIMSDSGVRYSVLVIDACRDNPLPRQAGRSVGRTRGLGRVDAPRGTYVVYSAGIGEAALDRLSDADASPNSVFTRHLLPALDTRGVSLDTAVKQVRERVRADAASVRHQQNPAIYDQATGELFLAPPPPTGAAPAAPPPGAEGVNIETLFWQSIQASSRPAELRAYLDRWPGGVFAPIARARLAEVAPGTVVSPSAAASAPPAPSAATSRDPAAEPAPAASAPVASGPPDRNEVRRAQQRLAFLGLDPGPADGAIGPRTQVAIRVFRAAAGLPPDDDLDEETRARLHANPPPDKADMARALVAAASGAREARQPAEAARLLEGGLRLLPDPAAMLTLGDLQRELGRTEQARRTYADLRRLDPSGEAGRNAAARLAALPTPRPEEPPAAPRTVAALPAGACGVTFSGSRYDAALSAYGYSFANSCATEMAYRPVCPQSGSIGRGDLTIAARSATTVWVPSSRARDPGGCSVQSARPR
ncbi:caspase family protein [Roseomonas sp. CCTCC AB2023176]|uniref:caspase family protein n=1 Tax=Roseomonas sp. CCTCC AB2023176 TaxID=3342640 RepID=UPI0035DEC38D